MIGRMRHDRRVLSSGGPIRFSLRRTDRRASAQRSLGTTAGTTAPLSGSLQAAKCRKPASEAGFWIVGAARFELATFRPPAERATKLRHAPGPAILRELPPVGVRTCVRPHHARAKD